MVIKTIKVAFVCHFSNENIRRRLPIKNWELRNVFLRLLHHGHWEYHDFAVWVDDFITLFRDYSDKIELHIVAPHKGLRKKKAEFDMDGICYHFYKSDGTLFYDLFCAKTNWKQRTNYSVEGRRSFRMLNEIDPDLICLCGAENPEYGSVVFRIKDKPIYLIPQTLLNDPKRIAMKVASQYRVDFERKVFGKVDYVSSKGKQTQDFAILCNPRVKFFPLTFPSHQPPLFNVDKEYDYVFYANNVMKNKGIEDVLRALAIVKKSYVSSRLVIIGGCESSYKTCLYELIHQLGIEENVTFSGQYKKIDDVFLNVQKAQAVVVPGITAGLNSTVRESMLMGMPVVVYETTSVSMINAEKHCLLAAKMEDIDDLAKKMLFVLTEKQATIEIARNGKGYADKAFSNAQIGRDLMINIKSIVEDYYSKDC